uniref:SWIM-type domain-containing protein n=1 Tax=Ditylenchus dipsaci TaxID=166011 RepID=A0A915E694_9BILA
MLLTVAPKSSFSKSKRSFGEQLHIRHGSYNHAVREEPLPYPLSNYYDQVDEVRPSMPPPPDREEDVYESSDLAEPSNSRLNGFKEELVRQELWGENDHKRVIPIRDTAKCFSCMSKFYEAVWPALASVYKRPMNFTDKCNEDILEARSVPVSHCPTICVGMWEEITVGGVKIRGHIRGCMDDLLHNGFNQTIVAWYRWMARDSCREYRKRELFKLPVTQSDESSIHLCTCYADHCNHAASLQLLPPIYKVLLLLHLSALLLFCS